MHDLDVHAAFLRNVDGFRKRLQHLVQFVAQVGEIARVVSLEHPAKRDDLIRLRHMSRAP